MIKTADVAVCNFDVWNHVLFVDYKEFKESL